VKLFADGIMASMNDFIINREVLKQVESREKRISNPGGSIAKYFTKKTCDELNKKKGSVARSKDGDTVQIRTKND